MAGKRFLGWAVAGAILAGLPAGPAYAALPQFQQPGWTALTPEQKTILAPLQQEWAQMDAFRRKKWIGIAERFPDMKPEEQASIRRNMREWAKLAPEERRIAREKYRSLMRASPETRQAVRQRWEEYATLTEEEKERLRSKAPRKPKVKTPAKPPAKARAPSASRVATPEVPAPASPISPLKPPQSLLAHQADEIPAAPPMDDPQPADPPSGE